VEISVDQQHAGERIDKIIAQSSQLGRARVAQLFEAGAVTVIADGRRRRVRKGDRAEAGTVIHVEVSPEQLERAAVPDDELPLVIALERSDVVVVVKPAGVPSAPIAPGERGSIANALVARYREMAEVGFSEREPGLCHRLDTGTSGLILAARTSTAFERLTSGIRDGKLDKRYLLVCEPAAGATLADSNEIDLPLARHPSDTRRVIACADPVEAERLHARPAITRYRVVQRAGRRVLCEARAAKAFRHQIRVHFASIGAPLCGDELYGAASDLGRHALHASRLCWPGDDAVEAFDVESPLPPELTALVTT
jgi:23S rRNA pseudouridine1911/1915/1917 synthase